jgi:hypothetical protein
MPWTQKRPGSPTPGRCEGVGRRLKGDVVYWRPTPSNAALIPQVMGRHVAPPARRDRASTSGGRTGQNNPHGAPRAMRINAGAEGLSYLVGAVPSPPVWGMPGRTNVVVLRAAPRRRPHRSRRVIRDAAAEPARHVSREGGMGNNIRQQLRDKGKEIREHLADAGQTARQNVQEGLQSALSGEPRYFGGPPSGRPPSAQPPRRRTDRRQPRPS